MTIQITVVTESCKIYAAWFYLFDILGTSMSCVHLKDNNRHWSLRRKKKETSRVWKIIICQPSSLVTVSWYTCAKIEQISEMSVLYSTLILLNYYKLNCFICMYKVNAFCVP